MQSEKPLLIRWVLVLDVEKNQAEAFFSTDIKLEPEQIVNWFVLRWKIEVTFLESTILIDCLPLLFTKN
jgi:hypothetical protein